MSVRVVKGDIFKCDVQAIVNPANGMMRHEGGLAFQIAQRGGPSVVTQSADLVSTITRTQSSGSYEGVLRRRDGRMVALTSHHESFVRAGELQAGTAIITSAGNLPVAAVIHAVGPDWRTTFASTGKTRSPDCQTSNASWQLDGQLEQAHRNSIHLAAENGIASIAFPAISCGIFAFPVKRAAPIAIRAVRQAMADFPTVQRVVFCLCEDEHFQAFAQANSRTPRLRALVVRAAR